MSFVYAKSNGPKEFGSLTDIALQMVDLVGTKPHVVYEDFRQSRPIGPTRT